jgi:protein-S-isoprenylcysteine O-methyltransferase Ste14
MKKRIKINGALIFFSFCSLVLFPRIFFRYEPTGFLHTVIEAMGLSLILLGQMMRISSRGFKAENSGEGKLLLTTGPYSFVRNPMYLGILLIGLGIVLMLFKWWVVLIFLAAFFIRYTRLIYKEEEKLNSLFSKDYPDYIRGVPRILPSLKVISNKEVKEYLPLKLSWIEKEIGAISTVLFIVFLLESFEGLTARGLTGYLKEIAALLSVIIFFIFFVLYLAGRLNGQTKHVSIKS